MFADYRPDADGASVPTNLVVRAASAADCPSIAAIEHERDAEVDTDAAAIRCRTQVDEPNVCLVVAIVGNEICGFGRAGRFEPAPDAAADSAPAGWYLLGLIVSDRWRRRGIGRRLTETRLAWLMERRAGEAFYFVNAGNRVSLDLHEALGFRELTRDFSFPGATFEGGIGSLGRIDLSGRLPADDVPSRR
jgi:ribosomal protein S18 acetylase RimI-like enzyme